MSARLFRGCSRCRRPAVSSSSVCCRRGHDQRGGVRVERRDELAQGLEVAEVLGGELAAVGPDAGGDLDVENPAGALRGRDFLAPGSGGWCRVQRAKPSSEDRGRPVEREDVDEVAGHESSEPLKLWRRPISDRSGVLLRRRLDAPDDLHHRGRRHRDRCALLRAFEQPLAPALPPGSAGRRASCPRPPSLVAATGEHRLVELIGGGKRRCSIAACVVDALDRRSTLGCQCRELLATFAGGGSLLRQAHDRVVRRRAQLSRQSLGRVED